MNKAHRNIIYFYSIYYKRVNEFGSINNTEYNFNVGICFK